MGQSKVSCWKTGRIHIAYDEKAREIGQVIELSGKSTVKFRSKDGELRSLRVKNPEASKILINRYAKIPL